MASRVNNQNSYNREKFMSLKLATWNVALPVAAVRREALRKYAYREQADVWVLTTATKKRSSLRLLNKLQLQNHFELNDCMQFISADRPSVVFIDDRTS